EVLRCFPYAHPALAAVLAASKSWTKWASYVREPAQRWSKGCVTLIGDAAHPMLPFLAQGAAIALEDAAVLSAALLSPADIPKAFATYENHRLARTSRIVRASRRQ